MHSTATATLSVKCMGVVCRVAMRLPRAGAVFGDIIWVQYSFAGIRFRQPVYLAIVLHHDFPRGDRGWLMLHESFGLPLPAVGSGYA